ncbi:hypothetical protein G5I_03791 [Acromyrmex echinatior]|uniref:Uncharacterized protein n=1 Tax=Acromyrmex echinatior TaxID=103372 RepID=F4WDW6_ACREC|nr:hypothetical protein G5I_03791 [Acromyrmex echinatior]
MRLAVTRFILHKQANRCWFDLEVDGGGPASDPEYVLNCNERYYSFNRGESYGFVPWFFNPANLRNTIQFSPFLRPFSGDTYTLEQACAVFAITRQSPEKSASPQSKTLYGILILCSNNNTLLSKKSLYGLQKTLQINGRVDVVENQQEDNSERKTHKIQRNISGLTCNRLAAYVTSVAKLHRLVLKSSSCFIKLSKYGLQLTIFHQATRRNITMISSNIFLLNCSDTPLLVIVFVKQGTLNRQRDVLRCDVSTPRRVGVASGVRQQHLRIVADTPRRYGVSKTATHFSNFYSVIRNSLRDLPDPVVVYPKPRGAGFVSRRRLDSSTATPAASIVAPPPSPADGRPSGRL